jgi:hypothetical protein
MANGDIVSPRINLATTPASLQPQPPHFGIVTDASGFPTALDVLWDTFRPSTLAAASLADTGLDVIEDPDASDVTTFLGKTVVPISPLGPTSLDDSGGVSREYVGIVVSIYRRTPAADPAGSGSTYLLMKSGDLFCEDLASQFVVLSNR